MRRSPSSGPSRSRRSSPSRTRGGSTSCAADLELGEALEQQTATSNVLKAISRATFDLQPVLQTLVENATRLAGAEGGLIAQFDGQVIRFLAEHGASPAYAEYWRRNVLRPGRGSIVGRVVHERKTVHIVDVLADPEFEQYEAQRVGGYRSVLAIPMLKEDDLVGLFFMWRTQVRAFTDKQIDLVATFADQAVIAIENVRLFTELETRNRDLSETLEQQTATGEILRVISSSPTDVQPVFDTIARNARRLCEADSGAVFTYDGELIHLASLDNVGSRSADALRGSYPMPATRGHASGRAILEGRPIHIVDAQADRDYDMRGVVGAGLRSVLAVPMMRDGKAIGIVVLHTWGTPRPFSDNQVALLQTFADQAVIAVHNVRLFKELNARNHDLSEALAQQTATGEVLELISRSTFDLQPVLESLIENAVRLCGADKGFIYRQDGELYRIAVSYGHSPEWLEIVRSNPIRQSRGSATGRAVLERRAVHIPDILADPEYTWAEAHQGDDRMHRTILAVPMLREGAVIGVLVIRRTRVESFTDKQIDLVTTFADQAVIAIENVRLFQELETRNRDLTETLEQQLATSEILTVISSSPTDVQPVFESIARSAARLCEARFCFVFRFDGELLHFVAQDGPVPEGY